MCLELAVNIWRLRDVGRFTNIVGVEGAGAVGYEGALTPQQKLVLTEDSPAAAAPGDLMDADELARQIGNTPLFLAAEKRFLERVTKAAQRNSQREAPVRSGTLRRSLTSRVEVTGTQMHGIIGTNLNYAQAVHEGAKPHIIRAKSGGLLRFTIGTAVVFRQQVRHPGQKANPFFARGLAATRDSIDRYYQQFADEVFPQ